MSGSFIHSLVATDICTGWTEAVPRMVREQSLVVEGLEAIARQLPFQVLGIDSDNDSAFINETLVQYCAKRGIEFTRSRAYRNNDQAWIEQKNGSVVRRFTGHDRYSGRIAGQAMVHPYKAVSAYVNYFQPSFKLLEKMRDGAKTIKRYSPPATPCDRLMQDDTITAQAKEEMSECRAKLDPVALLRSTSEAQSALAARYPHTTHRKQLPVKAWSGFWPACPAYGNRGKPGPRIRRACAHPAHWRTRKEPFEGVWLDVLLWLEKDPDTNARDCWQDCAKVIRAGSEMLNCEPASAGPRTGAASWPGSWSTLLPQNLHRSRAKRWNRLGLGRQQGS